MKRLELNLQADIVKYLQKRKIWKLRYSASTTFGIPDILVIYKGVIIGIEIKREDGEGVATALQKETLASIVRAGGIGVIVESLDDVKDILAEIDYNIREGLYVPYNYAE